MRMIPRFFSYRLRILLLVAAVLGAQWLLAQHEMQIEAHASHTSCEWCLAHASLTDTLPSAFLFILALHAAPRFANTTAIPFRSVLKPVYASRAPPSRSVV